ncbi:hypothetical protein PPERSA_05917 [Pseudocohnilembus persalinus]|uniref:EF-hand domain-containing protein n=1 Tax=Pseudocohnilembus persalinus TaxID=266149 RepID=A0A0V0R4G5_PSEPJ|nr:hypothetical protein PPERSA_05917 [Pseudocohnilembus persalinus]|eukprot:KRX09248.1 hypothetical protein PPERSA_05917 [Pseudocohnilembus persalinus]
MEQLNKTKKPEKLKLKDLPPQLREKYKNHPIFQEQRKKKQNPQNSFYGGQKVQQDKQLEIQKIKEKKEKPLEERLAQITIQQTVYGKKTKQISERKNKECFGVKEVGTILAKMNMHNLTKSEIQLMIWDFDENLDGKIDRQEFENMYKKCTMDENDLEPKSLFHMVQFLMFIYSENRIDNEERDVNDFSITQEDMFELLYVKLGSKQLMDEEIEYLFGDKNDQLQAEKRLTFPEYLELINKRAIENRRLRIEEKKKERNTAIKLDSTE